VRMLSAARSFAPANQAASMVKVRVFFITNLFVG
jgi:hypothetical protein